MPDKNNKLAYPREFFIDKSFVTGDRSIVRTLTINGSTFYKVWIWGVPDGVSPLADCAAITKHRADRLRLYVYSEQELDDRFLVTVDQEYGNERYPIVTIEEDTISRRQVNAVDDPPQKYNYYTQSDLTTNVDVASIHKFIECRHFMRRHDAATIVYDNRNGKRASLVLPRDIVPIVLLMPPDFNWETERSGFFKLQNGLILRVYSKYTLAVSMSSQPASPIETYDVEVPVSKISTDRASFVRACYSYLATLKFHDIVTTSINQIVAKDEYVTVIIGSLVNVVV